jgi:hypothetical protein
LPFQRASDGACSLFEEHLSDHTFDGVGVLVIARLENEQAPVHALGFKRAAMERVGLSIDDAPGGSEFFDELLDFVAEPRNLGRRNAPRGSDRENRGSGSERES